MAQRITTTGQSTSDSIIAWLSASSANHAVVADGSGYVRVALVRPASQSPHLRTQADGSWTDNLLALPTF